MNHKQTVELVKNIVGNAQTAEMVVDALNEAGVIHVGYGNKDIDQVVQAFSRSYGTTKTSKYDRFAASRLVSKHGTAAVVGIIELLAARSSEKYAPIVGNIAQLEEKWVNVLNFLRDKRGDLETIDT